MCDSGLTHGQIAFVFIRYLSYSGRFAEGLMVLTEVDESVVFCVAELLGWTGRHLVASEL